MGLCVLPSRDKCREDIKRAVGPALMSHTRYRRTGLVNFLEQQQTFVPHGARLRARTRAPLVIVVVSLGLGRNGNGLSHSTIRTVRRWRAPSLHSILPLTGHLGGDRLGVLLSVGKYERRSGKHGKASRTSVQHARHRCNGAQGAHDYTNFPRCRRAQRATYRPLYKDARSRRRCLRRRALHSSAQGDA